MITLKLSKSGWIADFSQSINAEMIKELFDSYEIPTAYTSWANKEMVLKRLQAENPNETVSFE